MMVVSEAILPEGQLPPQAPELEQAVIGAILLSAECMSDVADILTHDMFYVNAHNLIYKAIEDLHSSGSPIDVLIVAQKLKEAGNLDVVGGPLYIAQLVSKVASTANVEYHARIVAQKFIAREVARVTSEASSGAMDDTEDAFEVADKARQEIETIVGDRIKRRSVRYCEAEMDAIREMGVEKKPVHSTGFYSLDKLIRGFAPGDLVIVGARPGMAKSSFLFSMAMNGADNGFRNCLLSMELTEESGQARLFAARSGVPLSNILDNALKPSEIELRMSLQERDKNLPLWIRHGSGMTVSDIRAEAQRLKRKHDIGALFIDQLNWVVSGKKGKDERPLEAVVRGLKMIGKDLGITMVVAHQLNRAVETRGGDKRPMLSDLRDDGSLEQDAQIVLFPYRPEYYAIPEVDGFSTHGMLEVIVAKNSNGSTGSTFLRFQHHTVSVHDDFMRSGQRGFNEPF